MAKISIVKQPRIKFPPHTAGIFPFPTDGLEWDLLQATLKGYINKNNELNMSLKQNAGLSIVPVKGIAGGIRIPHLHLNDGQVIYLTQDMFANVLKFAAANGKEVQKMLS